MRFRAALRLSRIGRFFFGQHPIQIGFRYLENRAQCVLKSRVLVCRLGIRLHAPIIQLFLYHVCAMPIQGGPYLAAAFFCEKVLREPDGVATFVRVVDRWVFSGPDEVMQPNQYVIQATIVVMFKSGIHRGNNQLIIAPTSPSDIPGQVLSLPVLFEGDEDRGQMLIQPMIFPVSEYGIYWFRISIDEQCFTEIPLRVVYHRVVSQGSLPPNLPPQ